MSRRELEAMTRNERGGGAWKSCTDKVMKKALVLMKTMTHGLFASVSV